MPMCNPNNEYKSGSTVSDNSNKFKSNVSNSNPTPAVENSKPHNPRVQSSDVKKEDNNGASNSITSSEKKEQLSSESSSSKTKESSQNSTNNDESNKDNNNTNKPSDTNSKTQSNNSNTSSSNGVSKNNNTNSTNTTDSSTKPIAAAAPKPKPQAPVLKGTLSYNVEQRRHNIRGNWSYENAPSAAVQRFEYLRNLSANEDVTKLPLDGEYHGSFNIFHVHTNAKGKRKERTSVITESGVVIKFLKKEEGLYEVKGEGRNDYGTFELNGTATKVTCEVGELTYDVILRKTYMSSTLPVSDGSKKNKKKSSKRKHTNGEVENTTPPEPSKSYPKDVVCLKGKLKRVTEDDGGPQVIHRIKGMWSGGLDKLLDDPDNSKGLCNPFEYEHRCSGPSEIFPLPGRYTGWFLLNRENGEKVTVQEKDVNLKFKKNSEGYYNVEGRGMNGFGKYTITGTLSKDNELIIFRHFHVGKSKARHHNAAKTPRITSGPSTGGLSAPKLPLGKYTSSQTNGADKQANVKPALPLLSLDDVNAPDINDDPPPAMKPLENGAFSVLSRGILKVDQDGQHSCTGKWALSRDHFEEKKISNFMFGLKSNDVPIAAKKLKGKSDEKEKEEEKPEEKSVTYNAVMPDFTLFPLDSELYYGQFKMKRGTTKVTTIRDQQIVLKFRKNSVGSYNVYGLGVNELGKFDLLGTFLPRAEGSGQIELYRIYHPIQPSGPSPAPISGKQLLTPSELSSAKKQAAVKPLHKLPKPSIAPTLKDSDIDTDDDNDITGSTKMTFSPDGTSSAMNLNSNSILPKSGAYPFPILPTSSISPHPATHMNRSSSRQVKLPSRLEDDDPKALHARIMDKCSQVLRFMIERDAFAFFAQPVDPLALGIPTYHQVITNPMDLGTISKKLQANAIESHTEFAKLVRLVFNNAMTFNVDVTHRVHQNAKDMLALFDQKFREVEKEGEKLEELLRKEKRGGKSSREAKKREKEASKEARKKLREEQKLKRKRERDEKTKVDKGKVGGTAKRVKLDDGSHDGFVTRAEFDSVVEDLKSMKKMMELIVAQFASTGVKLEVSQAEEVEEADDSSSRKKENKTKPLPKAKPKVDVDAPLTREEQIELTETINDLPEDKLQGVLDILRQDMNVLGDDDELDLEIDALKTSTQRKLQRYVRQKKPKPKPTKKAKTAATPAPASPQKADSNSSKKVATELNVNAFPDSDSDSSTEAKTQPAKSSEPVEKKAELDVFGKQENDNSDSDSFDGNFNFENFTTSNKDSPGSDSDDESEGEDDAYAKARKMAANESSRAEKRKISEQKVRRDAELATQKRLKEAAAQRDQMMEQRKQAEAEEARLEEEKKKEAEEARKKARDELRKERDNTKQECDLDEERKLMLDYEYNYGGGNSGSNSPGSDFGF